MMMTGRPGRRSFTLVSSSMPEPPGMRMSDTSTCGASSSRAASTSFGLVKLRTAKSSRASAFSSTKRMDWSSSTIQMGFIRYLRQRDHDPEDRLAGHAVAFDHALVLLHERLRQREPQTRSAVASRYQRVEDAIA